MTFGLNMVIQSLPSFLRSLATVSGSNCSLLLCSGEAASSRTGVEEVAIGGSCVGGIGEGWCSGVVDGGREVRAEGVYGPGVPPGFANAGPARGISSELHLECPWKG